MVADGVDDAVRQVFAKIVKAKPRLRIENVSPEGNVVFSVTLEELNLGRTELEHPITKTRFFVNFFGEVLVRQHIDQFADILTGFDARLYDKIICSRTHKDFGMFISDEDNQIRFKMHISLAQKILTEDFDRVFEEKGLEDARTVDMPDEEEASSDEDEEE